MIKFGPSGNSIAFSEAGFTKSEQSAKWVKDLGLSCFEYSFGRGVNMSDERALEIGCAFKEQGVEIPAYQQPKYSDDDERALGELEASKIIKLGYDEMEDEANRLAEIGTNNMTVRDKAMFTALTKELKIQKDRKDCHNRNVRCSRNYISTKDQ